MRAFCGAMLHVTRASPSSFVCRRMSTITNCLVPSFDSLLFRRWRRLLTTEIGTLEDRLRLQRRRVVGVESRWRCSDQRLLEWWRRSTTIVQWIDTRVTDLLVPHAARPVSVDNSGAAAARLDLMDVVAIIVDARTREAAVMWRGQCGEVSIWR